jgi:hypothetical protein
MTLGETLYVYEEEAQHMVPCSVVRLSLGFDMVISSSHPDTCDAADIWVSTTLYVTLADCMRCTHVYSMVVPKGFL